MRGLIHPPGPRKRFFSNPIRSLRGHPEKFLASLATEYGDIARFRLGWQEIWLLSHPDLIHEALVTQAAKFVKSSAMQRARIFMGDSLLVSVGEAHRRQRQLVLPAFHRSRLAGYADTMMACAVQTRDRWRAGDEVDIAPEMNQLTLAIAGRALFSSDVEGDVQKISAAVTVLIENLSRMMMPLASAFLRLPLPANRRLNAARTALDEIIYRLIRERRAGGPEASHDLLSMLVFAEDAENPGSHLSDEEVRDQAMGAFLAGHETTANALAWTWWLLSQNPGAESLLHAELDQVLAGRPPTLDDLRALSFTEKVVREAMRLFPPVWAMGRRALEPARIGGYNLPRGALVLASPWVVHQDARYFAEPLAFRPERWTPAMTEALPLFAYFPFGGGPRRCIGENFAWMELILVMATLAQRWRLRAAPGAAAFTEPRITLRMQAGLRLKLEPRN
ncbi:MAG TPA: cytochrome P450 [Opitutaceae bacterium]|jgi:cytochrome P450|nr:cytochrome P450 [Opitutaceae bacterium]